MTDDDNPAEDPADPRDSAEGRPDNPPTVIPLRIGAPVRVSKLNNAILVRAELARLYREARAREGRYPTAQVAGRLASILGALRLAIEVEDLEKRLVRLEIAQENRG